jgi:hypothetical protein
MGPKAALCFILNYEHVLVKEAVWRKWLEPLKDIVNVYFYYSDLDKIKSPWIRANVVDAKYIRPTTYVNVMPAYLGVIRAALKNPENQWIIFLTDFCAPIVSPQKFRNMFYQYCNYTLMAWRPAWWNISKNHRGNLHLISENLHLANSPWFTLNRLHAFAVLQFLRDHAKLAETVFNGEVANESFFAIALCKMGLISRGQSPSPVVISTNSHIADWGRMSSATSPHKFEVGGNYQDRRFIQNELNNNPSAMFIRKIMPTYPDEELEGFIHQSKQIEKVKKPLSHYLPIVLYNCCTPGNVQVLAFLLGVLLLGAFFAFEIDF